MGQPKFMNNLNTLAGIRSGVQWVRNTGSKFDQYVHAIACAIIVHAKDHGDCTQALALVKAMPKSARRAALVRWFTAFSPISVTLEHGGKGKDRVGLRKPDAKLYNAFDVDGARANPYYDWDKAEDNALAALLGLGDFNDKVLKLADAMQKKLDEKKVEPDAIEAMSAKVKALRLVVANAA